MSKKKMARFTIDIPYDMVQKCMERTKDRNGRNWLVGIVTSSMLIQDYSLRDTIDKVWVRSMEVLDK